MTSLIDTYLLYKEERDIGCSSYSYRFDEGSITYDNYDQSDIVCIRIIHLSEEHRNKGIYSNFIKYLMTDLSINKIIVAMLSNSKVEYATAKNYIDDNFWINQGGDCIWCRNKEDKIKYTGYIIDKEKLEYIKSKIQ